MTKSKQVIKDWIEALERPRRPLTTWETDFVESVSEQFEARGDISDKQEIILERIYSEKT